MKKIILMLALVASWATFAQKSEYNAHLTLENKSKTDIWHSFDDSEVLVYDQSTVGYFRSSQEIKKVLAFYSLDFNNPIRDESLLEPRTAIDDYKQMSFDLLVKNAVVAKYWYTETHKIAWACNDKFNTILIIPKQK